MGEIIEELMSAIGTKRTSQGAELMSAFRGKADIARTCFDDPLLTQSRHRDY